MLEERKINAKKKKFSINIRNLKNEQIKRNDSDPFDNNVRVDNFINLKPMLETDSDLDTQKGRNNNKRHNSVRSDSNVQDPEQKCK